MYDYYQVLGIGRTATLKEIQVAYRRLLKLYHPDLNGPAASADKTVEINNAFEVLSDSTRRLAFDQSLGREDHRNDQDVGQSSEVKEEPAMADKPMPGWFEAFVKSWAGTAVGVLLVIILVLYQALATAVRTGFYCICFIVPGVTALLLFLKPQKTFAIVDLAPAIIFYYLLVRMSDRRTDILHTGIRELFKESSKNQHLFLWVLLIQALILLYVGTNVSFLVS